MKQSSDSHHNIASLIADSFEVDPNSNSYLYTPPLFPSANSLAPGFSLQYHCCLGQDNSFLWGAVLCMGVEQHACLLHTKSKSHFPVIKNKNKVSRYCHMNLGGGAGAGNQIAIE